ncbi:hypothetical protein D3C85_1046800 [compost metagenome]
MVSRRRGNDAVCDLFLGKRQRLVQSSANLKGTRDLQGFRLKVELAADGLLYFFRSQQRCVFDVGFQPFLGFSNILNGRVVTHSAYPSRECIQQNSKKAPTPLPKALRYIFSAVVLSCMAIPVESKMVISSSFSLPGLLPSSISPISP